MPRSNSLGHIANERTVAIEVSSTSVAASLAKEEGVSKVELAVSLVLISLSVAGGILTALLL